MNCRVHGGMAKPLAGRVRKVGTDTYLPEG